MVKKCPKSGQKRVPAKSGTIKTKKLLGFLTNRGGGLGPPPTSGRGGLRPPRPLLGGGRRPPPKEPKQNLCFYAYVGLLVVESFRVRVDFYNIHC